MLSIESKEKMFEDILWLSLLICELTSVPQEVVRYNTKYLCLRMVVLIGQSTTLDQTEISHHLWIIPWIFPPSRQQLKFITSWNFSTSTVWFGSKIWPDIHGPWRTNSNKYGDSLYLKHHHKFKCLICPIPANTKDVSVSLDEIVIL